MDLYKEKSYHEIEQLLTDFKNQKLTYSEAIESVQSMVQKAVKDVTDAMRTTSYEIANLASLHKSMLEREEYKYQVDGMDEV